jgi:hypothetical protein
MAEDSAFWDGTAVGDAASTTLWSSPYSSAEFGEIYSKILGSHVAKGYVVPTYGNDLKVSANNPVALNVLVATGALFVRGKFYENTSQITAVITAADITNPRIDRVVARISLSSSVQTIRTVVLAGTPAATPALPALTQNATTYEISLAYVWVAANATTISDVDVHDEREFAVNFREAAYKTVINQVRNSEFLGDIQSRIYPPAEWDLVNSPSVILTATKPAQMVRGNYVSITADAASEGISQTIPVLPSSPYAFKFLINVTAGDVGQIVVTTNSASPNTITRTIRRTAIDLEERIFYTTESDATTLTIKYIAVNNTDVIKAGQALMLPGYNAGPFRVCSYNEDVILLDRIVLTANQATLDFQNIPSGYRAIKIVASLRTTVAATSENITARINNDSGANYDALLGLNSHSGTLTTVENLAATSAVLAQIPANTAPANVYGALEITIPDYDNTSRNKAGISRSSAKLATTTGNVKTGLSSLFWRSNSAITRITLLSAGNYASGSMIEIYLLR